VLLNRILSSFFDVVFEGEVALVGRLFCPFVLLAILSLGGESLAEGCRAKALLGQMRARRSTESSAGGIRRRLIYRDWAGKLPPHEWASLPVWNT
jgi:hypothetical protein